MDAALYARAGAYMNVENTLTSLAGTTRNWAAVDRDADGNLMLSKMVNRWFAGRDDLRILEIGTCRCIGASLLAQHGTIYTLDVFAYDDAQKVLNAFGTQARVLRLAGPQEMARQLLVGKRFDCAFLDGEHDYAPVMRDFAYLQSLTDRVIFHDYDKHFAGCYRAINELKDRVSGDWYTEANFAAWDGSKNGN